MQPGRCCHHLPHAWLHIAGKTKAITSELSSLMSSKMQHIQAINAIFE
jgi:hypothetical protein